MVSNLAECKSLLNLIAGDSYLPEVIERLNKMIECGGDNIHLVFDIAEGDILIKKLAHKAKFSELRKDIIEVVDRHRDLYHI